MKKNFILLFALFSIHTAIAYQAVYDYQSGDVQKDGVDTGDMIYVKVININTFKYKVTIKGTKVDYNTPVPDALNILFSLEESTNDISSGEAESYITSAIKTMESVNAAKGSPLEQDQKEIIKICKQLKSDAGKLIVIINTKDQLLNLVRREWPDHGSMISHKEVITAMKAVQTRKDMVDIYNSYVAAYLRAEVLYEMAEEEAEKLIDKRESIKIKGAIEQFEEGYEKLTFRNYLKMIDDLLSFMKSLEDKESFTVKSDLIEMNTDAIAVNIKVEAYITLGALSSSNPKSAIFEVPAKKGWKPVFGVGPAFSFVDGAKDDLFFIEPDTDPINSIVRKRPDNNVIRPGIAAMMSAYRRSGNDFNWGPMMGVGVEFEGADDVNVSYYFGLSAIVGKKQKFIVSGGVSFLRVNRFTNEFLPDKLYSTELINAGSVTDKTYRASLFLSISFALASKVDVK